MKQIQSLILPVVLVLAVVLVNVAAAAKNNNQLYDVVIYDVACDQHTGSGVLQSNISLGGDVSIQLGFSSDITSQDGALYRPSPSQSSDTMAYYMVWASGIWQTGWLNQDSNGCYWGAVVDPTAATGFQVSPSGSSACSWTFC